MPVSLIDDLQKKAAEALDFLHSGCGKLQTGRASVALVENLMVDSYGSKMPLKGVANISIPESDQIMIQPWSHDQLALVEKAIRDSDLGLNPQNDGIVIRLVLPPMTEDRRKDLIKLVHKYAEEAHISVRNARHDVLGKLKTMEKEKQIGEDDYHGREVEVQKIVDTVNEKIEEAAKKKEADIRQV